MVTTRLDWVLTFPGEHLIDQIAAWRAEHRATHPPTDERPASPTAVRPAPSSAEPPAVPPPPPEIHPEQVIEDDPESVVRVEESDGSVEQINNTDSVLDHQEE